MPIHASAVFVDCGTLIVVRIHDYLSVFDSHIDPVWKGSPATCCDEMGQFPAILSV